MSALLGALFGRYKRILRCADEEQASSKKATAVPPPEESSSKMSAPRFSSSEERPDLTPHLAESSKVPKTLTSRTKSRAYTMVLLAFDSNDAAAFSRAVQTCNHTFDYDMPYDFDHPRLVFKAATDGFAAIVALLAERGADMKSSTSPSGMHPVHVAASHNRDEVIWLLVQTCGVKVDQRGSSNETPLHAAANEGAVIATGCRPC